VLLPFRHDWPLTERAAVELQDSLRPMARLDVTEQVPARTVAGLDVAYDDERGMVAAAVVVLDLTDPVLPVLTQSTATGPVFFPYVPGLLAFRELPALVEALERLPLTPDVLICDGYGLAHPRRFGLACHLGVLTGRPTFGVAKTAFTTAYDAPGPDRGDWSELRDTDPDGSNTGSDVLGRVVRTQRGVKPVFVSIGHAISLDQAYDLTLRLTPSFRLPETTRRADHLCRQALRARPGTVQR
jgi:deoxyribonuclease V